MRRRVVRVVMRARVLAVLLLLLLRVVVVVRRGGAAAGRLLLRARLPDADAGHADHLLAVVVVRARRWLLRMMVGLLHHPAARDRVPVSVASRACVTTEGAISAQGRQAGGG